MQDLNQSLSASTKLIAAIGTVKSRWAIRAIRSDCSCGGLARRSRKYSVASRRASSGGSTGVIRLADRLIEFVGMYGTPSSASSKAKTPVSHSRSEVVTTRLDWGL